MGRHRLRQRRWPAALGVVFAGSAAGVLVAAIVHPGSVPNPLSDDPAPVVGPAPESQVAGDPGLTTTTAAPPTWSRSRSTRPTTSCGEP